MNRSWKPVRILIVALLLGCPVSASETAERHVGKGYELLQLQQYEEAAEEFQRAVELDSKLVRARYQLAVCRFALRQTEQASYLFEALASQTSGSPEVLYYLGRLRLLASDFDGAVQYFERVAFQPPFPDTQFYLGVAYMG